MVALGLGRELRTRASEIWLEFILGYEASRMCALHEIESFAISHWQEPKLVSKEEPGKSRKRKIQIYVKSNFEECVNGFRADTRNVKLYG